MFNDIEPTDWFYNAVSSVVEHGLFKGTSDNEFSPQENMTRAMFAQVLANLNGVDLSQYTTANPSFEDVLSSQWYFAAVEWALELGVVSGVGYNQFSPSDPITREQMAVMQL
jgi:hypothetical protein